MFIARLGIKAWQGAKTLIGSLTRCRNAVRNTSLRSADTCGLTLKHLGTDTVQISNSAKRWLGEAKQYIPDCSIPNSQVPSHGNLEGLNGYIRYIEQFKNGKIGSYQMCGGYYAVLTDKEFAKLAPLEKDCIGYRGVQRGLTEWREKPYISVNNAKIGDIIVPDLGCGYASPSKDLAETYVHGCMLYKILIPKGARVSRNMAHGGEILMPRGAEYKLISKQVRPNGIMDVTLEYILPKSIIPEDIPQIKKIAEQYVNSTDEFNREYAQKILDEISKLEKVHT